MFIQAISHAEREPIYDASVKQKLECDVLRHHTYASRVGIFFSYFHASHATVDSTTVITNSIANATIITNTRMVNDSNAACMFIAFSIVKRFRYF